ncbi:hypothetical protein EVAR_92197_1 [Eumeta japonica]|uniref:Uncharacterized protein n=1 Tax=Eumeta variegata TaxID=151549 RepID=A0A4C1TKT0_EUMVA|nr:hypothetical protein EVAR_92197_1 [Eumeta japonica]
MTALKTVPIVLQASATMTVDRRRNEVEQLFITLPIVYDRACAEMLHRCSNRKHVAGDVIFIAFQDRAASVRVEARHNLTYNMRHINAGRSLILFRYSNRKLRSRNDAVEKRSQHLWSTLATCVMLAMITDVVLRDKALVESGGAIS